ncbi:MAG: YfiR family protein [Pseudomonadota bacterium]
MKQPGRQSLLSRRRFATSLLSLCLVSLTFFSSVPTCQGRDLPEHQIKAAFLFNFAAFVSWPEGLFESADTPLRFCTMEADAISRTLEQLISGESLDGRPLELIRLGIKPDITGCHILFLGSEAVYRTLSQVGQSPGMLTVGDTEKFIERGGMIALLRQRKRIHPVINLNALDESTLRLSSKLLRLATRVRPGSGK